MRTLIYFVATTLDGRIAAPDGAFDFFGIGDHFAYQVEHLPETIPAHLREAVGASDKSPTFDTVIMGRKTYEVGLEDGIDHPYAPLETVVFSQTLAPQESPVRITGDDPVEAVRELKSKPGRAIWLCGGGTLAAQLVDEIDELRIKLNPVLVGAGVPLLDAPFNARTLQLTDTRMFDSGVIWLTYSRAPD